MLIFSFDCAAKNFGVCVCEFNENWKSELNEHIENIKKVNEVIKSYDETEKNNIIDSIHMVINEFLKNIFKLVWFNTIDLMPGIKIKKKSTNELTHNLKAFLTNLGKKYGTPDLILIEHQMKLNDISRIISYQIMYHYSSVIKPSYTENIKHTSELVSGVASVLDVANASSKPIVKSDEIKIVVLACNIKNSYSFKKDLEYYNFIEKYSNYVANKKHTLANFMFYLENLHYEKITFNKKDKLDDAADAFMMVYGYLKNVIRAI